jgi:hypothetical protein
MGRSEHPGEHPAILEAEEDRSLRFGCVHHGSEVVQPVLERERFCLRGSVGESRSTPIEQDQA